MASDSSTTRCSVLAGHRVIIVLGSLELGGAERQAVHLARYLKDTERADVQVWGFQNPGQAAEFCQRYGIPWRVFPFYWDRGGYAALTSLLRLARALRRIQPAIILPYTMPPNVACGIVWRGSRARVCVWNQRDEGIHRLGRIFERWAVWQTPLFVSNSEGGARFLADAMGVPTDSIRVIHNGVALPEPRSDRMAWRARLQLNQSCFVACMMANLHSNKDHVTLLQGWRRVVDQLDSLGRPAVLLLAGRFDGTQESLMSLSHSLRLGDSIRFLGPVDDMSGLLQAVDLAVLSSRSEGCPNGVLEPMAAGLAVVGTDIPGIREAVGSDGYAYLAPLGDHTAMADRIVSFALDPEVRCKAGDLNRRRIQSDFNLDRMCKEMVTLIVNVKAKTHVLG